MYVLYIRPNLRRRPTAIIRLELQVVLPGDETFIISCIAPCGFTTTKVASPTKFPNSSTKYEQAIAKL